MITFFLVAENGKKKEKGVVEREKSETNAIEIVTEKEGGIEREVEPQVEVDALDLVIVKRTTKTQKEWIGLGEIRKIFIWR